MKEKIENAMAALIGRKLWVCRRAADMAMFHFGERRATTTVRGEPTEVGEYALHVQCAWRLTNRDKIVTARRDLYFPPDRNEPTDDFDWDRAPNLQDKILSELFGQRNSELTVLAVEVGEAGRLHIVLDEGFAIDVMPDDSADGEHWRIFVPRKNGLHFIFSGRGIEVE